MSNNKRHFEKWQMQQQLAINAKLITFYHGEAANEKASAKAHYKSGDHVEAYRSKWLVNVYKTYIKRLAAIQRTLKGCLRVREGLSKAEAEGRWPVVNQQVH